MARGRSTEDLRPLAMNKETGRYRSPVRASASSQTAEGLPSTLLLEPMGNPYRLQHGPPRQYGPRRKNVLQAMLKTVLAKIFPWQRVIFWWRNHSCGQTSCAEHVAC